MSMYADEESDEGVMPPHRRRNRRAHAAKALRRIASKPRWLVLSDRRKGRNMLATPQNKANSAIWSALHVLVGDTDDTLSGEGE
jgi:hypothetical protein